MYKYRVCPCGTDITDDGVHYCSLLERVFDAGPPVLDTVEIAEALAKERARATAAADKERRDRWFESFIITKFTGNPMDGMAFGGDPMGAAAAAAELRGESLEKVIKENLGPIKEAMSKAGLTEDDINMALRAYFTEKDNSWF
jgi:hypothetical protein